MHAERPQGQPGVADRGRRCASRVPLHWGRIAAALPVADCLVAGERSSSNGVADRHARRCPATSRSGLAGFILLQRPHTCRRLRCRALPARRSMIPLLTLRETLDAFAACNDDGHVHEAFGWVHATGEDPLQARFWLPPDEATAVGDDDTPPAAARALGLAPYLEPATFADVLDVQKRQRPLSTLYDYAQALAYYAEYDAFLQVEGVDEALGEADEDAWEAARAVGVGAGVFASFDLVLARCPPECVKPIAQQVAHLLDWPIGQALAACRAGSLTVGEALDGLRAAAIAADFAALGVPLQVQGYKAFPWMPVPTLA
ncbi:DUF7716 domain-containing protein [Xanthomonas sacchari]|uniref:DUF7716 domain-containing protein n=1 Tax=Xanthomonas sacchari TaxID=56458 RepID=UPI00224CD45F|nr:hypothetical protein [Xanthomonas sacchari]